MAVKRHLLIILSLILIQSSNFAFSNEGKKPRVSIITSVWNGDEFMEGFLEDVTKQSIFPDSELILINANSPGHEEPIIKKYMEKFSNIKYLKLEKDPGLYAVWNLGIRAAQSELVTNANIDDRHNPLFLEKEVKALEGDPTLDLVYADFYYSYIANAPFEAEGHQLARVSDFSPQSMQIYMQGPHPVWRKALHKRCGEFNEIFSSSGDWEMFCRAVSQGAKFKKIEGVSGVWYWNPTGISMNSDNARSKLRDAENQLIRLKYKHLWE